MNDETIQKLWRELRNFNCGSGDLYNYFHDQIHSASSLQLMTAIDLPIEDIFVNQLFISHEEDLTEEPEDTL